MWKILFKKMKLLKFKDLRHFEINLNKELFCFRFFNVDVEIKLENFIVKKMKSFSLT